VAGRLYVGTSGFAYKEWVGPFYPPGTKGAGMLAYYAGAFPSVEVNYTFRRNPSAVTMEAWVTQTPEGFVFACKANQGITHFARLVDAGDRLKRFLEAVAPLGSRLGPVLFQCPPNLRYDPAVLDGFLAGLPSTGRYAMEFRHPSFDADEVRDKLAASGVAWCAADTEETPAAFVRTAPDFAYLRLRRDGYSQSQLAGWAGPIRQALRSGIDVYAYLKHEDSAAGPRDAAALRALSEPEPG
jgi:uncharacterized protein YecE (DUF72 family)